METPPPPPPHSGKRLADDSSLIPTATKRRRRRRRIVGKAEFFLILKSLDNTTPFLCSTTNSSSTSISLRANTLYTFGRSRRYTHFFFHNHPSLSKRHCQIFYDSFQTKILIFDGFSTNPSHLLQPNLHKTTRPSTNGVFVNGTRIQGVMELSTGDQVSFVCGNQSDPSFVGFSVERIVFPEQASFGYNAIMHTCEPFVGERKNLALKQSGKTMMCEKEFSSELYAGDLIARAVFFLNQCRETLLSVDPISYIRKSMTLNKGTEISSTRQVEKAVKAKSVLQCENAVLESEAIPSRGTSTKDVLDSCRAKDMIFNSVGEVRQGNNGLGSNKDMLPLCTPTGKKFYLNRLEFIDENLSNRHEVVSLPELLHPVATLSRIFIATFTSDVLWFLSYCEVPNHLPVTIACHNTERCWSADPDKRTSTPYANFPNLVLVYPQFPDVVAFGKDRKKQGVACHHPKLMLLKRKDSIRVVVTSANLVSKQWNSVTNTVWWQDFPRRSDPDYSSLFTHLANGETFEGFRSDFAAQLAGFVASLVADVPSQAQWIVELSKYDFGDAVGHLVASVPGMHRQNNPYPMEPTNVLCAKNCTSRSVGARFLGSVEASVVGLRHRFHTAADSKGAQLKTLAAFLAKCRQNAFGMTEVILQRNNNIPADANAVSVLICDLDEFSEGDYIQLGFLPKTIASWVAPLCDAGFFGFSAYIYPKEVLAAAFEGSNSKVQLKLYVVQGPKFFDIPSLIKRNHFAAICSLLASVQRCTGLWRLKEILAQYKWPELLETDFIYGSSSVGTSVDPKFLAAFSAAAGKKSVQYCDSGESDPEWGVWDAKEELQNPSMRILFPTIERVRDAPCGVWPSKRLLCFSEKTWQKLKSADILHDAIPHPSCRVGYPMHVKVARRRFQRKKDESSFGWVYCGSHNFSPAAWGRPVFSSSGVKADEVVGTTTPSQDSRLHICNYELGIIFIVPPSADSTTSRDATSSKCLSLDDIVLPFVVPAPKYRRSDRPATAHAMREALAELAEQERKNLEEADVEGEMMEGEIAEEEEVVEMSEFVQEEEEVEKAYAETLWSQVDSSES